MKPYRDLLARSDPMKPYRDLLAELDTAEIREIVDQIGRETETSDLEQLGDLEPDCVDPIPEIIFAYAAQFTVWAQERFPHHSARAIEGIERLLAASLYAGLVALPGVLFAIFGLPGFAVGIILAGAATFLNESQKRDLSLDNRIGLSIACPTCAAPPDMWCITIRGSNPGSTAKNLHTPRLK